MVNEQLARRGIRDAAVLDALRRVPREWFVPDASAADAYADNALSIDCAQTISQPYMVARMTELLELRDTDRVLEVGTGSGYQTAILALLAREVFTIEWWLPLMLAAGERLKRLGLRNIRQRCGDGSTGWPDAAPFDAIIVTAGAPHVPASLRGQLAVAGRLVTPIGPRDDQTLVRVRRNTDGYATEELLKCRFVKLVGDEGWKD
ncbi:MAG: protein-L-isoaspartate(D-aspartate) O-methyltransferase [Phycisphaerae bacterium]